MINGAKDTYREVNKSWQILLSSTQAGPGRKVKQEQEEISRNHVPRLFLGSVGEILDVWGLKFLDGLGLSLSYDSHVVKNQALFMTH